MNIAYYEAHSKLSVTGSQYYYCIICLTKPPNTQQSLNKLCRERSILLLCGHICFLRKTHHHLIWLSTLFTIFGNCQLFPEDEDLPRVEISKQKQFPRAAPPPSWIMKHLWHKHKAPLSDYRRKNMHFDISIYHETLWFHPCVSMSMCI